MEISQLEFFRALAEELHFTRAAQRVHCVQSNVTTQVQALEDELGAPLFDRLSKRATVTDAGRRFLPCAEIVLSTILQARTIAAPDSTPLGILRIGSSESLFTYRLPRVLSEVRKRYPAVELSFALFLHDGLLHSIDSGRLDLAICMVAALGDDRIKSLRLRTERMLFIAGPKDLLATKRRVQPTDLTTETLLITESGCAYRRVLVQMLSKMNVRPTKTIEFSSVGAIKECARARYGDRLASRGRCC